MSESTGKQLPHNWVLAKLPQIAVLNPSLDRCPTSQDSHVTFVPMSAVDAEHGGLNRPESRPFSEVRKGYTNFISGDILFAKITPCMENGKICVVPQLPNDVGYGSTEFHVLRPKEGISASWVAQYMSQISFRRLARSRMTGSAGQMRVPTFFLEEVQIPIPPLPEQIRILEKLDQLFSDLDKGVAFLERVARNLNRYRSSVLKAAVEGKLTAAWRKRHRDVEPAKELLKRILAERRCRWENEQLSKFKTSGKEPPKDWKDRYQDPSAPDSAILPRLPSGWCWASFDQLAEVQGGLQKSPSRQPVKNHYPYLRVANVHRGRLKLDEVHRFELTDNELENLRLRRGDLLIVEGNGSVTEIGRSALWNDEIENCVHQNHIIRVRFSRGIIPEFADTFMNSPVGQIGIQRVASSTSGLHTLSVSKVRNIVMPLPPTEEQQEITEDVERRLSILKSLAQSIERQTTKAESLRQSILKRAFAGRLVSQPPDEPAFQFPTLHEPDVAKIRRSSRTGRRKSKSNPIENALFSAAEN